MTYELINKALDRIIDEEDLEVKGYYDPKSDDMTGWWIVNGVETDVPYPSGPWNLFDWIYWNIRQKRVRPQLCSIFEEPEIDRDFLDSLLVDVDTSIFDEEISIDLDIPYSEIRSELREYQGRYM